MNLTVVSAFRNSSGYVQRYFDQMGVLRQWLLSRGDTLWLILGEGDSTDGTFSLLCGELSDGHYEGAIYDVTHNGREYGSVVHPIRFLQLAAVWNTLWAAIPQGATAVLFLEADLIWDANTIIALLNHLKHFEVVAPMVLKTPERKLKKGELPIFYDIWAFRRNGRNFTPHAPYHDAEPEESGLFPLDSAGSCLALRGDVARQVHFNDKELIVGVCRQVVEIGGSVWLDPSLTVFHP